MTDTAAAYLRVSTDDQVEGSSLKDQRERTEAQAQALGMELVEVYEDAGVSGSLPLADRPAGARLLEDAAAGKFTTVIVAKLDRFGRSLVHSMTDLEALEALGCGVKFIDIGMDTNTPVGKLIVQVMAVFAGFERSRIRERMAAGAWQSALDGRWPGGLVPFGYQLNDEKGIEVHQEEAETVRYIFKLRAEGLSRGAIARRLNREGITPRQRIDRKATAEARQTEPDAAPVLMTDKLGQAVQFAASSIQQYTSPEASYYIGAGISREVNRPGEEATTSKVFTFTAPAIVELAVWKAAQKVRSEAVGHKNTGQKIHSYGLASGQLLHLHDDGTIATMYAQPQYGRKVAGELVKEGSGRSTSYRLAKQGETGTHTLRRRFRCTAARAVDGQAYWCSGLGTASGHRVTAVNADRIEGLTLLWMLNTLQSKELLEEHLRAASATLVEEGADPANVADLKAAKERATRKRTVYVDQFANGLLDDEEYAQRIEIANAELEAIDNRLAAALNAADWLKALEGGVQALLNVEVDLSTTSAKRAAIRASEIGEHKATGAEWLAELEHYALAAVTPDEKGTTARLPVHIVQECKRLAAMLGVQVTLSERKSWGPEDGKRFQGLALGQWPDIAVEYSPDQVLSADGLQSLTESAHRS